MTEQVPIVYTFIDCKTTIVNIRGWQRELVVGWESWRAPVIQLLGGQMSRMIYAWEYSCSVFVGDGATAEGRHKFVCLRVWLVVSHERLLAKTRPEHEHKAHESP